MKSIKKKLGQICKKILFARCIGPGLCRTVFAWYARGQKCDK